MISTKELKQKALLRLKGNWSNTVVAVLLFFTLSFTVSMFSNIIGFILQLVLSFPLIITSLRSGASEAELETVIASSYAVIPQSIAIVTNIALTLLVIPLSLGLITYFLNFAKNKDVKISALFESYKNSFGNSILMSVLIGIYTFLWSLLLVIPGIIKAYSYSMSFFIMAENPKISANDAIAKSQELMNGHKWEYFILQLSFLGWILLATFTCCIGYLWLTPYMQTTISDFYLKIKEDHEETKDESQVVLEQF